MKYYRILLLAAVLTGFSSCAVDPVKEFEADKPQDMAEYEYLNKYDVLKNYVDRTASPDFKLGAALSVSDFAAKTQVYSLAASNFDEMTAGNAMKHASVVDDKGNMNLVNVKNFVKTAEEAGMTVYGHTLAWHSQQNKKYLTSLIADKEVQSDGTKVVVDAELDYTAMTAWYYWGQAPEGSDATYGISDGMFKSTNPAAVDFYMFQYFVADNVPWAENTSYKITMMIRASEEANITLSYGNWTKSNTANLEIGTEWEEVTVNVVSPVAGSGFVMFQSGNFVGTIEMKSLKVTHEEANIATVPVYLLEADFNDGTSPFGGWGNGSTRVVEDGVLKITNPSATDYWSAQMAWDATTSFVNGQKYVVKYKVKASAAGTLRLGFQITSNYAGAGDFPNVSLTTDWQEVEASCICSADGATRLIFSFGDYAGDIYIDDFQFYYEKSANTVPLTPEEKKDTLVWAMDTWIKGVMEATAGKVTAWDVVNEAIAGADYDGDGKYDLQHEENGDASNFYWQDYLGDEDYVRIAVAKAREHFAAFGGNPADLKLFINDYNLESDWDDNKKLESLIEWIDIWESDGVTVIDGIATQMHVSYYENADVQESKKAHVVRMLELMAATGKLVKISELDMGYVDASGKTVATSSMTEDQHKAMATYYKFIVSKYLDIIPASQQYGITQWCITDAPGELGSGGWRNGEPVGLWDQNYNRKHTYAGFAEGLIGD